MAEIDLGIPGLQGLVEVGAGGFASVYSANEPEAGRQVAVKVLRAADDKARSRFDRERRTLGMMTDHAHIVTMFRSGFTERGNHPYLVLEYMPGGSLEDRLDREERLSVDNAVELIVQIADALGFAHDAGIVHRDVKPANILLSRTGVAKLTDFGISAVRDATGTSQMGFSVAYAPPETFHAGTADDGRFVDRRDERSDLYSLAATLYALIAGTPPFAAQTHATAMRRILTEPPLPTGFGGLDHFLAIAMAKDPADRFATANEFSVALRNSTVGQIGRSVLPSPPPSGVTGTTLIPPSAGHPAGVPSPTVPLTQTLPTPKRSRRRVAVGAGLAAVGLAAIAAVGLAMAAPSESSPGLDTAAAPGPTVDGGSNSEGDNNPTGNMDPVVDEQVDRDQVDGVAAPSASAPSDSAATTTSAGRVETATNEAGAIETSTTATTTKVAGAPAVGEGSTTVAQTTSSVAAARTNSPALADSPNVVAVLRRGMRSNSVVALNDGLFASVDFATGVQVWNRDSPGGNVATYTGHAGGASLVASLDGGLIASGGSYGDGTVHVWDPKNPGTAIATYTGHDSQRAVTAILQLNNGLIVSGDAGGSVQIWDPADPGTTIDTYDGHSFVIITKLIQLSNGLVLSNGEADGAHVWNVSNPNATRAVYSAPGSEPSTTYTYDVVELDGGLIASYTLGGLVHVWSPDRANTPMATFTGHSKVGALLGLSGGLIASGGENGEIHIWDPADPTTRLLTYSGHTGTVYSLVELDSGMIASTASNEVHIWNPYSEGG